MICVEELPRFPTSVDEVIEEQIDQEHRYKDIIRGAAAQARAEGITLKSHVLPGHAVPTICEFVDRERVDLLVVGHMAIQHCTTASLAARRIVSSNSRRVQCWSSNDSLRPTALPGLRIILWVNWGVK